MRECSNQEELLIMAILNLFMPDGKITPYSKVTDLRVVNGLTIFYSQPDATLGSYSSKKITTTLPILMEEEIPGAGT